MKSVKQQIHECVTEQLLEEVIKLKERVEKHKQDVYSPVNSLLTRQLQALTSQCNTLLGHLPTYPDCGLDKDHLSYVSYTLEDDAWIDGCSRSQSM